VSDGVIRFFAVVTNPQRHGSLQLQVPRATQKKVNGLPPITGHTTWDDEIDAELLDELEQQLFGSIEAMEGDSVDQAGNDDHDHDDGLTGLAGLFAGQDESARLEAARAATDDAATGARLVEEHEQNLADAAAKNLCPEVIAKLNESASASPSDQFPDELIQDTLLETELGPEVGPTAVATTSTATQPQPGHKRCMQTFKRWLLAARQGIEILQERQHALDNVPCGKREHVKAPIEPALLVTNALLFDH
jgi:hypothetical protein